MKRFDIEVYGGHAYLVGNPDGKFVKHKDALENLTALFDVTAQRDQLLAALEHIATAFEAKTISEQFLMDEARAVIQKVRGGEC